MGASINLPRLFGIPIRLHFSWFLIFVLFTLVFENHFDRNHYPWGLAERMVAAVVTSILLFLSVLGHELSHSLLALRRGLPVKSITLFLFGGVSQIGEEAERPFTEFAIAVVGPLASIVLGFLFLAIAVGLDGLNDELSSVAEIIFMANIALGIFNMLPLFPMDGGRVFRAFVWWITGSYNRATNVATMTSQVLATAMVGLGIALAVLVDGFLFSGMWMVVLGIFLQLVSSGSHRNMRLRQVLEGAIARDLVTPSIPIVLAGTTIQEILQRGLLPAGAELLLVADDGGVQGMVSRRALRKVLEHRRHETVMSDLMLPLATLVRVGPEDAAWDVLELMDSKGLQQVVVQDGSFQGLIERKNMERFLRPHPQPGA